MTTNSGTTTGQSHVGSQIGQDDAPTKNEETSKSEGTQAGGTLQMNNAASIKTTSTGTGTRTKDYNDEMVSWLRYCRDRKYVETVCLKLGNIFKRNELRSNSDASDFSHTHQHMHGIISNMIEDVRPEYLMRLIQKNGCRTMWIKK